jgi:hypothetical protein
MNLKDFMRYRGFLCINPGFTDFRGFDLVLASGSYSLWDAVGQRKTLSSQTSSALSSSSSPIYLSYQGGERCIGVFMI